MEVARVLVLQVVGGQVRPAPVPAVPALHLRRQSQARSGTVAGSSGFSHHQVGLDTIPGNSEHRRGKWAP
eukprot:1185614-Prorocentrum_minimum.AAC.7